MPPKRRRVTNETAIAEIMKFVDDDEEVSDIDEEFSDEEFEGEENDNLDELYDEEGILVYNYIFAVFDNSAYINTNKLLFFALLDIVDANEELEVDDNEEEIAEEENVARPTAFEAVRAGRLRRRQLTSQRLVHNIDSAIDLDNYNQFELPVEETSIEGVVKVDRNKANDISYKFHNQPPQRNIGRQNRANIIAGPQGVLPKAKNATTPREAFELFFTPAMIDNIVKYSNDKIERTIQKITPEVIAQKGNGSVVKLCTQTEIHAFIGLLLYRGLWKQNTLSITKLFSLKYGPAIYAATMSMRRFKFLLSHLSFDDDRTRDERWPSDRFAAIRELF